MGAVGGCECVGRASEEMDGWETGGEQASAEEFLLKLQTKTNKKGGFVFCVSSIFFMSFTGNLFVLVL